jgi:hypothetical protein
MLKRFGDNGRRVAKHHTGAEFANTICSALKASGSLANGYGKLLLLSVGQFAIRRRDL